MTPEIQESVEALESQTSVRGRDGLVRRRKKVVVRGGRTSR